MASREPSVASLASALVRTGQPPPEARIAIARPGVLMRTLIAAVLVLSLGFVAALLAMGQRIHALVGDMRHLQADLDHRARLAIPSDEVLRSFESTRHEVLKRPLAAGPIWLARCELLAREGDWRAIETTCVHLGLTNPDDLLAATRLLHAEALFRQGRYAESDQTLYAIDQTRFDAAAKARAADLLGRLLLIGRPAPAATR